MNVYLIKKETAYNISNSIRRLLNIDFETDDSTFSELVDSMPYINNADSVIDNSITEYHSIALKSIREQAFIGCSNLTKADFPNVTGTIGYRTFDSCTSLVNVNIPKAQIIGEYAFYKCTKIETLSFNSTWKIQANAFNSCYKLSSLILRAKSVVTLVSTNALTNTKIASKTGYIYVPSNLVNSYKTATNWTVYANQIKSIDELDR